MNLLEQLLKLANKLDGKGLFDEANMVDEIIKHFAISSDIITNDGSETKMIMDLSRKLKVKPNLIDIKNAIQKINPKFNINQPLKFIWQEIMFPPKYVHPPMPETSPINPIELPPKIETKV